MSLGNTNFAASATQIQEEDMITAIALRTKQLVKGICSGRRLAGAAVALAIMNASAAHAFSFTVPGVGKFNSGSASSSFYFSRSKTRWINDRLRPPRQGSACMLVSGAACSPLNFIPAPWGQFFFLGCTAALTYRCDEVALDSATAKKKNQCLKITMWHWGGIKEIAPKNNYCIN